MRFAATAAPISENEWLEVGEAASECKGGMAGPEVESAVRAA